MPVVQARSAEGPTTADQPEARYYGRLRLLHRDALQWKNCVATWKSLDAVLSVLF